MKKYLIMLLLLFLSTQALAYRFEEYEWGSLLRRVHEKVKDKKNVAVEKNRITYDDRIAGSECKVVLAFTPETEMLARITLEWKTAYPGDKVLKYVLEDNSVPHHRDDFSKKYTWGGSDSDNRIELDYGSGKTVLTYYGGEFWRRFQEEKTDK